MKIPFGFIELVKKVHESYPTYDLINSDDQMWKNFCWSSLLGKNRTTAEVHYVFSSLNDEGIFEREIIEDNDWMLMAIDAISIAKDDAEEPSSKKKIDALNKIEKEISQIETTIKSGDEVFLNLGLTAKKLRKYADEDKIGDLLAEIVISNIGFKINPNKIPGIGYTKAVLWMHACGVGLDFAPDNNHTKNFLEECGFPAEDYWEDYYIIMSYMKKVKNNISEHLDGEINVALTSHTAFLYESIKSLLKKQKYKQLFNPRLLLSILNENELDITDLEEMLDDLEYITDLEEMLEEHYSKII